MSSAQGVPPLTRDEDQFDARPDSPDSEPPIDLPLQDLDPASRADLPVSRSDLFQEPASSSSGRAARLSLTAPRPSAGSGRPEALEGRAESRGGFGAGMLVIGLVAGFGGGFFVGQRVAPPPPRASAAEVSRPASLDAGRNALSGSQRAPEGIVVPTPLPPVEVQAPEVQRPVSDSPEVAGLAASAEPGALQVESRPSGAEVYLDEVRVGTTPMTMNNVKPGSHRVRVEMPGRRPWSTAVNVEAGALAHVGASLE